MPNQQSMVAPATPAATGTLEREINRVKSGRIYLIPGSEQAAGYRTTGHAKLWKAQVAALLQSAPRLGK
jgi:homoserine O-acetyltransferase/O-succinyltransferase